MGATTSTRDERATAAPAPTSGGNATAARTCTVTPVDASRFATDRVSPIRHTFHEHPLMQLDALRALAKELYPTNQCRFAKPGTTIKSSFEHDGADPAGRNIDEVFDRLAEPGSWLALYNVETHPTYRKFLDEVNESCRHLIEPAQTGIYQKCGFIFISSPPSATPFHIDREHNFWLQVRGRKLMTVWDHRDRASVAGEHVDRFVTFGDLTHVKLADGTIERGFEFDVRAGDGVYFPSTSPHMTRTDASWGSGDDAISVSIGTVFYSDQTRHAAHVHAGNLLLRKLGMSPAQPGESAFDALKAPLGRSFIWAKKTFQGFKPTVSE